MQMVKNFKEDILCLCLIARQFMNIINNQQINHLIEMQKIVAFVVNGGVNELSLELMTSDI